MSRGLKFLTAVGMFFFAANAEAINPFGLPFGATKEPVLKAIELMQLGTTRWVGGSLIIQAQDDPRHSYLLNFCQEKLYSVSQTFPNSFDKMAGFVEISVRDYGQPVIVSAYGVMTDKGFLRPINLYWKIDNKTYVRLMQMPDTYAVVYEIENSCNKVPN